MTYKQRFILICDFCDGAAVDPNPTGKRGHHPTAIAKHHGWETINDRAGNGETYQIRHKCKACQE